MAMDNVRSISTSTTSSINSVANNVSKSGSTGDSLSKFKQSFEEKSDNNKKGTTKSVKNVSPAYKRIKKRNIPKDDIIIQLKYQQNLIKNKIPSEQENISNPSDDKIYQYTAHDLSAKEKHQRNMAAKFYSDIAEEMRYL